MNLLRRHLFDYETPETRGEQVFFRVLELFILAFTLQLCWKWGWMIRYNGTVVKPLGLANFVDVSFLFDHNLSLVNAALVTLLCLLGFFRLLPQVTYPAALLFFHLQYVARFCLGKAGHGANFIGMSLMGLALAMVCFREPKQRRRFTLGFIYLFLGLGYVLAAASKLVGSGITWPDGVHLWMWIAERKVDVLSTYGAFTPNVLQHLALESRLFATLVLTFGLLTEALGFLMWGRRSRYFIIPPLIAMHLGVALTMNIVFDLFIYELILLGVPWAYLIDRALAGSTAGSAGPLWRLRFWSA